MEVILDVMLMRFICALLVEGVDMSSTSPEVTGNCWHIIGVFCEGQQKLQPYPPLALPHRGGGDVSGPVPELRFDMAIPDAPAGPVAKAGEAGHDIKKKPNGKGGR